MPSLLHAVDRASQPCGVDVPNPDCDLRRSNTTRITPVNFGSPTPRDSFMGHYSRVLLFSFEGSDVQQSLRFALPMNEGYIYERTKQATRPFVANPNSAESRSADVLVSHQRVVVPGNRPCPTVHPGSLSFPSPLGCLTIRRKANRGGESGEPGSALSHNAVPRNSVCAESSTKLDPPLRAVIHTQKKARFEAVFVDTVMSPPAAEHRS